MGWDSVNHLIKRMANRKDETEMTRGEMTQGGSMQMESKRESVKPSRGDRRGNWRLYSQEDLEDVCTVCCVADCVWLLGCGNGGMSPAWTALSLNWKTSRGLKWHGTPLHTSVGTPAQLGELNTPHRSPCVSPEKGVSATFGRTGREKEAQTPRKESPPEIGPKPELFYWGIFFSFGNW